MEVSSESFFFSSFVPFLDYDYPQLVRRCSGPANPTNPFLNGGGGGGGGYNYGMTGNGDDEYIRRSFQV